jgi:hypothetical protein
MAGVPLYLLFQQKFERLPLKPDEFHGHLGNRRICSFGHKYVFAGQVPRDASIPDYFEPLMKVASQISEKPARASVGNATDHLTKTPSRCRFWRPARYGCAAKPAAAGNAALCTTNHGPFICSRVQCETIGNTASRRWKYSVIR